MQESLWNIFRYAFSYAEIYKEEAQEEIFHAFSMSTVGKYWEIGSFVEISNYANWNVFIFGEEISKTLRSFIIKSLMLCWKDESKKFRDFEN